MTLFPHCFGNLFIAVTKYPKRRNSRKGKYRGSWFVWVEFTTEGKSCGRNVKLLAHVITDQEAEHEHSCMGI